jgi:hypothetical protein
MSGKFRGVQEGRGGGVTDRKGQHQGGGRVQRVEEARLSPWTGRRLDGGDAGVGADRTEAVPEGGARRAQRPVEEPSG